MTELSFDVLDIRPDRYAVVPTLIARLRIAETTGAVIHMIALQTQIKVDVHLRAYQPAEKDRLREQFGEPDRWTDTLRPFTWTHATINLPGFQGSHEFDLPIECTYDLEVLGSRYLHALDTGEAPLEFLFNGSVITKVDPGFHVIQIPWHKAAQYRMPVTVWRELMDLYFPNRGWIRLHRDTIDALSRYKGTEAIPDWDSVMTGLLERAEQRP